MNSELISLNSESATNRLILLHGWGANADDLIPIGKQLIENLSEVFEIVSFSAPNYHPDGFGREWYSLYPHKWDEEPNAVADLEKRLNNLCFDQIPLNKSLVLGFSQGGAMALELAARIKFQGVFVVGSYPHPQWQPSKNMPPTYLYHGNMDEIVPKSASQKSYEILLSYGVESKLFFFDAGHEINKDLIDHCREIIQKQFLN